MKFGQDFQSALQREEYPREWIESAISYKKLKKCIKRVQQELLSLGLDQATLNALWQRVGSPAEDAPTSRSSDRLLQYSLEEAENTRFTPRLTIAIDPKDGSPMDAWLSPQTRQHLYQLARSVEVNGTGATSTNLNHVSPLQNGENQYAEDQAQVKTVDSFAGNNSEHLETVEIPLTSDSEFFQILRRELADLERLQENEKDQLQSEIERLGNDLRVLRGSRSRRSKADLTAWRKIFELYSDSEVFLSSHEQDAGTRDGKHAQKQLQQFTTSLATQQQKQVLQLGKEANVALDRFLQINIKLLRLIKFQEINRVALTKIMKKFNKRTALHGQDTISRSLKNAPFISQDLAKVTCFTISEEILQIIPQLNDYLCPVCFSITYKPVRLRCNHVFCIRCLIVLQRQEENNCPLCRKEVVLEATEENLDKKLASFLKSNFKEEVKEKQKANEIAAGIDRWGEAYEKSQKCVVM